MAVIEPIKVTLKNSKELCIRTPIAEDTTKAVEYLNAVFADDSFFLTTAEEAKEFQIPEKQHERIEKFLQDDNKLLVITVADGRIVSMSHVECGAKRRTQHVAYMGISILPDYRGNGLGTEIMQVMIDWATEHPLIEKLSLEVWSNNAPAIGLYEKMGFIEEGRKVRQLKYADGSYDDMVCMYRFVKQT